MNAWLIAAVIVVIVLLGWWIMGLINGPAEREFEVWVKTCLEKQAIKRGGSVTMSGRTALLTTPYKDISIEVSKALVPGQDLNEYIYAGLSRRYLPTRVSRSWSIQMMCC
jgi:hypothetical protein